jgi:hypothetical protein
MRFRRKRLLINRPLQFRVIGYLGSVSLAALGYVFIVFRQNQAKMNALLSGSGSPPTALAFELSALNNHFIWQFTITMTVMTLIFVIVGLWITHRVAGPIHRLKLDLTEFLNGKNVGKIHFRKGDEFKDLLDLINKIIARDKTPN